MQLTFVNPWTIEGNSAFWSTFGKWGACLINDAAVTGRCEVVEFAPK